MAGIGYEFRQSSNYCLKSPALTSVVCESCDCESDGNTVDGSDDADNGSL